MTASEDGSTFVTSEATDASMLRTTAVSTERRDSNPVCSSTFQVCVKVLRAFDSILVRPLKTWIRLDRDVSELRGLDYRDLRDIGVNRVDIARIRAGTYRRGSADNAERTDSPNVRWDDRPPQIFI